MQKYINSVANKYGTAITGASVLVKTLAGATATIYSDDGVTTTGNPLTTDANGMFQFYAADGHYTVTISKTGIATQTITDVLLEDPADSFAYRTTPYDFGAVGDGVADDTAALNLFFAAVVANPALAYKVEGLFKVTNPIVVTFVSATRCTIQWGATITSAITTLSDILTFTGGGDLTFTGALNVIGNGSTSYAARKNVRGVVINNCSGFSFDTIRVYYTLSHGLDIVGSTAMAGGKKLRAWYCGSAPVGGATHWQSVSTVIAAPSGSSADPNQTHAITLTDALPSYVDSRDWFIKVGARLHKIVTKTDSTHISVFPWLEAGTVAGAVCYLIGGGGYHSVGGDASCGRIDTLDALVCGVGHHSLSLYPTSLGNCVSQSNGITCALGGNNGDGMEGMDIGYLYSEGDVFGFTSVTLYQSAIRIGATVTFPSAKSGTMVPAFTDRSLYTLGTTLGTGFSVVTSAGQINGNGMGCAGLEYANQRVSVIVGSYSVVNNSPVFTLQDPTSANKVSGLRSIEMTAFGSGGNQNPTGTVTVTPPAGHNINGAAVDASYTLSGLTKPVTLRAIWFGSGNWKIARWDAV